MEDRATPRVASPSLCESGVRPRTAARLSVAEVSRLTGLPPHTLRFYERQFPRTLAVGRTPGGHRLYTAADVERLHAVARLLHEQGLSIREAQRQLGEACPLDNATDEPGSDDSEQRLNTTLEQVLARLGQLMAQNDALHLQIAEILGRQSSTPTPERGHLLAQIQALRAENRAVLDLLATRETTPRPPAAAPRDRGR